MLRNYIEWLPHFLLQYPFVIQHHEENKIGSSKEADGRRLS